MKYCDCKIVQDLLPNYIEDLTKNETNEFIEKHIEKCEECEQILKNMKGEIKLDIINNKKRINALKKVRNRFRLKLFIFLITVIIINIIGIYLWNNYRIITNENGEKVIERITFSNKDTNNYTNVIIKIKKNETDNTINGYIYRTIILTINEKGICVNDRERIEGYTKEGLENQYKIMRDLENSIGSCTNVEIIESCIYFNDGLRNNQTKEKIINDIKSSNEIESIEEY